MRNVNEKISNEVTFWCTVISVIGLIIQMVGYVMDDGLTIMEALLKNPLSYLTTFLPLVIGLFFNIKKIAENVNVRGIPLNTICFNLFCIAFYFSEVTVRFWVIKHFSMITGYQIYDYGKYFKGLVLLLVISIVEAIFYTIGADFDPGNVFVYSQFINWIFVSVINGYVMACATVTSGEPSPPFLLAFLFETLAHFVLFVPLTIIVPFRL